MLIYQCLCTKTRLLQLLPVTSTTHMPSPPAPAAPLQVGTVLAFSPLLTRGRRLLRGWVITNVFTVADLLAIL
jgi:hypothetical protein